MRQRILSSNRFLDEATGAFLTSKAKTNAASVGPHGIRSSIKVNRDYLISIVVPIANERPRAGAKTNCSL